MLLCCPAASAATHVCTYVRTYVPYSTLLVHCTCTAAGHIESKQDPDTATTNPQPYIQNYGIEKQQGDGCQRPQNIASCAPLQTVRPGSLLAPHFKANTHSESPQRPAPTKLCAGHKAYNSCTKSLKETRFCRLSACVSVLCELAAPARSASSLGCVS